MGTDRHFPMNGSSSLPTRMFVHKISTGYKGPYADAIGEVNGVKIRNLKHLVETLRDVKDEFVEFTFLSKYSEVIVFNRREALARPKKS